MSWSYSGDPRTSEKDEVRFLVGDTDIDCQLVQDEEILYAIEQYPDNMYLAAAVVLRSLASKFSKEVNSKIAEVSENSSDIAKAYADRADELDPDGQTVSAVIAYPSFGGLSISEKQTLCSDSDAVQPSFSRGMDDIPGGPPDGSCPIDTDEEC
jgi:hypothetical protein